MSSTQFWLNEPTVLFNKNNIYEIWPNNNMSKERKLNAISRFVILASILGYLLTLNMRILFVCIVTLAVIATLYKVQINTEKDKLTQKEGFMNNKEIEEKIINDEYTLPNKSNPLMNVLLPEISYNPNRNEGAPSYAPMIEEQINSSTKNFVKDTFKGETDEEKDSIKKRLFADLGDNYRFDDSMRIFYTTPNTQIPNDQGGFAQFCFGDMISAKENNPMALARNIPRLGSVIN